jgi:hypothetical protein
MPAYEVTVEAMVNVVRSKDSERLCAGKLDDCGILTGSRCDAQISQSMTGDSQRGYRLGNDTNRQGRIRWDSHCRSWGCTPGIQSVPFVLMRE